MKHEGLREQKGLVTEMCILAGLRMMDLDVCFFACGPLPAERACFSNWGLVIVGNADGFKATEPRFV